MRKDEFKEGLGDLAHMAELDHEVQMARSDLYKIAKYAIKLHDMLKGVSEEQGLEGWVQSKITKSADYLGSVYHNLDYEMKFAEKNNPEELSTESLIDYNNNLSEKLQQKINSVQEDRCTDIAKRKYKVWPSAYASGAVVRCRQGKIWKKKK
tara:strand:+ start:127 stop:582 length:456 start_codon:yes stop_codon:yes gene_type:complete